VDLLDKGAAQGCGFNSEAHGLDALDQLKGRFPW